MVRAEDEIEELRKLRDQANRRRSKRLKTRCSFPGSSLSITAPLIPNIQRTPSPTSSNDTMDSEDAIICDCKTGVSQDRENYIICTRCVKMQHSDCSDAEVGDGQRPQSFRCNRCTEADLLHFIDSRDAEAKRFQALIDRKRADAAELIVQVLWRQYCILPNGHRASDAVIEATRTKYEEGKNVPLYHAPQNWIEEVQENVKGMMDAAGKEATDFVLRPEFPSLPVNESILKAWGEIAVDLLHHGSYRGRRKELGILAEVLGLEMKGNIWKG